MNELLDLETKLQILAQNPCACAVCATAAKLAKRVLVDVADSGTVLLSIAQDTPEFRAAEQRFHADELARLQEAYGAIDKGRCQLAPPPVPDPIPALPDADAFRDRVEFYRKHQMKPRIVHRRRSVTMKKHPRIPGSYIIR